MSDIADWLQRLGAPHLAAPFAEHGIDFDVLPDLTDADLASIGVAHPAERRRILGAIAALGPDLRRDAAASPSATTAPAARAERRQLTVMYCDLVGSTALSARLDPEDLRQLVAGYRDAVAAAIAPFEGHVAQLLGDGVEVWFGYPRAHEDDAARALRAALAVADAVRALRSPAGGWLQVRIGIATGLVVVGGRARRGGSAETVATGEAPGLAARLQSMARPGEVVVAAETRRVADGGFEFEPIPERATAGGGTQPEAWRLLGERALDSRFDAHRAQGLVPLVGREGELALLLERWARACDGEGQALLLSGEAGIGKSRLSEELRERAAASGLGSVTLQCSPYHGSSALHPLSRWLDRSAGVSASDSPEALAARLGAYLQAFEAQGLPVQAVGRLLRLKGLPDGGRLPAADEAPQQEKARTLQAITALFGVLASRGPLLLLVEDAQWIDPTTDELLERLAQLLRDAPVFLLLTARPEYAPAWSHAGRLTRLVLGRLGQRQSAALARAVAGAAALPDGVIHEIVRRADGIPLFVEELTKAIVEAGGTVPSQSVPASPTRVVPATLQDSLTARLDRLPRSRRIAQVGAVIGREFPVPLLEAVAGRDAGSPEWALEDLTRADLIRRVDRAGEPTWAFSHSLVRDAAYQSLLKSERQHWHARVAEAMEMLYADRLAEVWDRLGEHCAIAGLWPKAADYFARAGARAFEAAAFEEAATLFERALRACDALPAGTGADRQRLRLLFRRHDALLPLGRYAPMLDVLEQAERLAASLGEPLALARVYSYQSHFAWISRADNDSAARYAQRSLELARELRNRPLEIANRFYLGQIEYSRGRLRESVEAFRANVETVGTSVAEPRFERFFGITSRGWFVFPLADLGRFDEAAALVADALQAAEASGDPMLLCPVWFGRAHLHWSRGEFDAAIAACERFAAEPMAKRLMQWYVPLTALLAASLAGTGQLPRALDLFDEVTSLHERLGLAAHETFTYAMHSEALRLAGRVDEAVHVARKALALAGQRAEEGFAALARWALGCVLLEAQPDDPAPGRDELTAALQASRRIGHRVLEAKCVRALGASGAGALA